LVFVLPPPPAPAAARGARADHAECNRDRDQYGKDQNGPRSRQKKRNQGHANHVADRQRPALPADRQSRTIAVALWREPFGTVAHLLNSLGGRPRLRGVGDFSFTPRAPSASRSRHSTCALTLLRSAAAERSTADHSAESTRSG